MIRPIPYKTLLFLLAMIFLSLSCALPLRAQQATSSPSVDELDELLNVIENPDKRKAFLKDLKSLIEARKTLKVKESGEIAAAEDAQQLLFVQWIFGHFEKAAANLRDMVFRTSEMINEIPVFILGVQAFFLQTENRSHLITLFLNTGIAIIIALLTGFFLSRPVRASLERMKELPSMIGWGCIYILLKSIPYLILCVVLAILLELRPCFPSGHAMVMSFFVFLFIYRTLVEFFHTLLSPDASHRRILSVSDENAQYLWIWTKRFASYAFLYFVFTRSLTWPHTTHAGFSFLRGLLLIPFPVMLTVFIFQIAREIRTTQREERDKLHERNDPLVKQKRGMITVIQYWPVGASGYIWAIFLSLIFHYERGFEYLFRATLGTAAAVFIMLLCLRGLNFIFRRFFRVSERVKGRFPGMEEKANRYVRLVWKALTFVVVAVVCGIIADIWGVPVSVFVASDTGALILMRAAAIILTVAVVISVMEICNVLSTYLLGENQGEIKEEISQKQKTLIPVLRTAINISAGFVGGIIILDRLGVNTTPILAGAGIIGLAVGFGSQALVKDLINGLFILFEESIRVGDWATVGSLGGMVESVGLRTLKLRDINGTVHIIPNSTIDSLSNYSKGFSRTVMDIGIAYREDVDEVIEILKDLGEELQKDPEHGPNILEPLEIFGLDRFEDSAVIIRSRFKTRPLKQWGVRREFYRRMKRAFDERGIEIPFPHQTLYMGETKDGKSPPLRIAIDRDRTEPVPPVV